MRRRINYNNGREWTINEAKNYDLVVIHYPRRTVAQDGYRARPKQSRPRKIRTRSSRWFGGHPTCGAARGDAENSRRRSISRRARNSTTRCLKLPRGRELEHESAEISLPEKWPAASQSRSFPRSTDEGASTNFQFVTEVYEKNPRTILKYNSPYLPVSVRVDV